MTAITRKIAVIGSNSFSGSDFIDLLLENPANEVIGISRSPENSPLFLPYLARRRARFTFYQLDLNRDMAELLQLFDRFRPEDIVNFAAQSEVAPSWEHPEQWFQTNSVALAAMINHLRRCDYLQRYLHVSSPEIYGSCHGTVLEDAPFNPSTPYAASKAAADMLIMTYVRQFGFPALFVRATNVYGAHQQLFNIIPRTVIRIRSGRQVELHGGGAAVKSYIHIRDISRGELAILDHGAPGSVYHLSPDGGISIHDLVERICSLTGVGFAATVRTVAERPGQDAAYVIDSSRARSELGWRPTVSLAAGLEGVINWLDSNRDEISRSEQEYVHRP